jgi:hypothetical protein
MLREISDTIEEIIVRKHLKLKTDKQTERLDALIQKNNSEKQGCNVNSKIKHKDF